MKKKGCKTVGMVLPLKYILHLQDEIKHHQHSSTRTIQVILPLADMNFSQAGLPFTG